MLLLAGRFGSAISTALAGRLGDLELTGNASVLVLASLELRGTLRPRDVQAIAGLTSGGTTKQLDRLEALGLVERSFGKVQGDRRAIVVSLTPAGHRVAGLIADTFLEQADAIRALADELTDLLEG